MRLRHKYALAGLPLGIVMILVMALPVLFVGQLFLKADHSAGPLVAAVSWAVLAFCAGFPPALGYCLGRRRESDAAAVPAAPPAGGPSFLQIVLGAVIGAFSAVFAYVGGVGVMILAAFALPKGAMERLDAAGPLIKELLYLGFIATVVLAGWGGYRLGSGLATKR